VNFLLVSMRFRFWGASEKKTFIGRLVDAQCFGGALECRVEYPSGFVCSHIHSWPGPLRMPIKYFCQHLRIKPTRVFKPCPRRAWGRAFAQANRHITPHHGRGRPEFVAASPGVCPRDRVDWSRKHPFQHSLRHPSLHEFRACPRT